MENGEWRIGNVFLISSLPVFLLSLVNIPGLAMQLGKNKPSVKKLKKLTRQPFFPPSFCFQFPSLEGLGVGSAFLLYLDRLYAQNIKQAEILGKPRRATRI